MRRRQFLTILGGAAAGWPISARAQQPIPVIGWLSGVSLGGSVSNLAVFREALGETGYVEHRNIGIEYRWADGQYDRLPAMAADLVARRVAVIATMGGEASALAAKAITSRIPIVMVAGGDPVQEGLVPNLNQPGGNVTGVTLFAQQMESKRLSLLHEAVPAAKTFAALFNPTNAALHFQLDDVRKAAPRLGIELLVLYASTDSEIRGRFRRNDGAESRGSAGRCRSLLQHPTRPPDRIDRAAIGFPRFTNGVIWPLTGQA